MKSESIIKRKEKEKYFIRTLSPNSEGRDVFPCDFRAKIDRIESVKERVFVRVEPALTAIC